MKRNGAVYCDAKFCNLRIASHDPERVQKFGKDFHNNCYRRIVFIVVIPARWREATNGEHKPRDNLFLPSLQRLRQLV